MVFLGNLKDSKNWSSPKYQEPTPIQHYSKIVNICWICFDLVGFTYVWRSSTIIEDSLRFLNRTFSFLFETLGDTNCFLDPSEFEITHWRIIFNMFMPDSFQTKTNNIDDVLGINGWRCCIFSGAPCIVPYTHVLPYFRTYVVSSCSGHRSTRDIHSLRTWVMVVAWFQFEFLSFRSW